MGEALKDAGIIVSNTDIVTPSVSSDVTPEMVITVDRVEIKEETVDTEIPYQSVKEPDPRVILGNRRQNNTVCRASSVMYTKSHA